MTVGRFSAHNKASETARKAMAPLVACLLALLVMQVAYCGSRETTGSARAPRRGVAGTTFYVATDGNDSWPGTSDRPWATPGYGSKQLKAGDTLIIRGGRYTLSAFWDDMITPPTGAEGAPITVRGEAGSRPVLAGKDNLFSAVDISNTSYVTIENLEITSDNGARFRGGVEAAGGPVSHAVLSDLYIHHIDEGAVNIGDVDDFTIRGCRMSYCGFGCVGGPAGTQGGCRKLVVKDCYLGYSGHYYQGGPGPSPYDRPDGFGIEPSEGPIEIVNTTAEHNRGDGLDSKAANTRIHECIVANNSCDGVKLWGHDSRVENTLVYGTGDGVGGASPWAGLVIGTDSDGARFEIENVTVHDNPERQAYPVYVQYGESTLIEVVMRNTIVDNGQGEVYFGETVKLTCDHNLFMRPGAADQQVHANGRDYSTSELEAGALGEGNLSRDPMFVAPAWGSEGDYHVREGSTAIDSGTAGGAPDIDLDGNARPAGSGVDIGAYEYGSGKPPVPPPAPGPSKIWYLAEGCTAPGFETWILVQNPGEEEARVAVEYMTDQERVEGPSIDLEGSSRATIDAAGTIPGRWQVSTLVSSDRPVVVERAMYGVLGGRRQWATASIGVNAPASRWYLAEGSTGPGFETWVLVENPGEREAAVTLMFMTPAGRSPGPSRTVPAGTRATFRVADTLSGAESVSTVVDSTVPVVAERVMYGGEVSTPVWATDSVGVAAPAAAWYLAEGCTAGGFETWILVMNPGGQDAGVTVRYMTDSETREIKTAVPANTRVTLNAADAFPGAWGVATAVTSDRPVVVERAMYGGLPAGRDWGTASIGASVPLASWYFAEGSTGPGFETWVLIENPLDTPATVSIDYMTPGGMVDGPRLELLAHCRRTISVADTVAGAWSVASRVSSDSPVVAERAMYDSARTWATASIGAAL